MGEVVVYKLDSSGRITWQYPGQPLFIMAEGLCLEAFFNRDDRDYGYALFKRGDRFVEYFYTDRWYNVFAVYDRDDGQLKGWYCNICRPCRLTAEGVYCEDLALDVWVSPAGQTTILDEQEFEALQLPEAEKVSGREALQTLLILAAKQQLPK